MRADLRTVWNLVAAFGTSYDRHDNPPHFCLSNIISQNGRNFHYNRKRLRIISLLYMLGLCSYRLWYKQKKPSPSASAEKGLRWRASEVSHHFDASSEAFFCIFSLWRRCSFRIYLPCKNGYRGIIKRYGKIKKYISAHRCLKNNNKYNQISSNILKNHTFCAILYYRFV